MTYQSLRLILYCDPVTARGLTSWLLWNLCIYLKKLWLSWNFKFLIHLLLSEALTQDKMSYKFSTLMAYTS